MKRICIIGSTGSIGRTTLQVTKWLSGMFKVVGLACNRNWMIMAEQVIEYAPEVVAIRDKEASEKLVKLVGEDFKLMTGDEGIMEVATLPDVDLVVIAVVGSAGLRPTIEAIKAGKTVALANKESLVMAGDIIMELAEERGVRILPVDSEHSAIFQCLEGRDIGELDKIVLTASGGPFLNLSKNEIEKATLENALNHPQWRMGKKVSIDSATLFNKGLEVIEAHHLFGIPYEKIDVVIHPQSIVHSLIKLVDSSYIAQLAPSDMAIPIQYALTYPQRYESRSADYEMYEFNNLEFIKPDTEKFPCLEIAIEAGKQGGLCPTVVSVADEVAVNAFIEDKLGFRYIPIVLEKAIENIECGRITDILDIFEKEEETRNFVTSLIKGGLK
ncbi:MAG: 1-deoxy-D-xylulose-5-phosphate reductoisomerase [Candidatus Coatesbacteria bacterium]|nr:MAG: 1-deoxy-D-xylulose-5-phosphate reductoisomerase [Candidatus Coatesbacteria bacterium]